MPDLYHSEASVMVIPTKGSTTGELVQGSTYVQNLVQTYTVVASSPLVLSQVITSLGLDTDVTQLSRQVDIQSPLNTVIIVIGVTDQDPSRARDIANSVASVLSHSVAALSPTADDGTPAVRIETIAPATAAAFPDSPNTRLITLLGFAAGIAVGVLYAIMRKLFGTRLTGVASIKEVTEIPLLGQVATSESRVPVTASIRQNTTGRVAESVRNVVASLRYVDVEGTKRVLLVTSPSESEGKTSVALGMSITLAEVGHRVLYIEADLRRPKAARYTQLDPTVGLTSVLVGDRTLDEAVQEWALPNLDVLLSGDLPPNPSQLLSSTRLPALLAHARDTYDYVIVDTAPVLPVADALWVAPTVDATIIVARMNKTTHEALRRALAAFDGSVTPLLGIIANDVKVSGKSGYYGTHRHAVHPYLDDHLDSDEALEAVISGASEEGPRGPSSPA
jgi:capsular exopolysaccharide synthesis family protein